MQSNRVFATPAYVVGPLSRKFLSLLCLLTAGLLIGGPVVAQVTVTAAWVPRKEIGETVAPEPTGLSDVVRLQANADSKSGITKVLFEVDEQFRAETTKPPYQYEWDTLDENDGAHTVTITAYNVNGQTGVLRLKVGVSNQLSLGTAYWVQTGMEAFQVNDLTGLSKAARRAMKLGNRNADALRLFALSEGMKGDPNRGFQILDDQNNGIPKEAPMTLKVRGYLLMARALNQGSTFAMVPDLPSGLALARQQVVVDLEAVKAKVPEDSSDFAALLRRGDALFANKEWDAALSAYERARKVAGENKTALRRARQRSLTVLLRSGRLQEAEVEARKLGLGIEATPTSAALLGAALYQNRHYVQARQVVNDAANSKNVVALVVASLADGAAGARAQAYDEAHGAVDGADIAETQYVAMAALADAGNQEAAKRTFRIAMYRAPLFAPTLIERAFDIMAYDKAGDRWVQALNLFDMVLSDDRDNAAALAGRLAAMMALKRYTVANPLFVRLSNADPTAPDLHVLRAFAITKGGVETLQSKQLLDRARALDPINYNEPTLPRIEDLVARMARLRRIPPITPFLLDIADGLVLPPGTKELPKKTALTK